MFNFWWSAKWSEHKTLTEMQKNEKGPISHWKIKCSFLDYAQLLMISRAIQAKNVDQNTKKWKRPPKSSKNKMLVFGLCSTSDDQLGDPSIKHWPKCKKTNKAAKVIEKSNVPFPITFNFWWSAKQSEQKTLTEMQKNEKGLLSHRKIKCLFYNYVQLLMIGRAIWAKNIDQNTNKGPLSYQKIKCSFLDYVQLLMISWVIRAENVKQNA